MQKTPPRLTIDPQHGAVRVIVCEAASPIGRPEGADKPLPTELVVMPWGTNQTAKGRIVVNETTLRVMPQVMLASNLDRIALDFEHNTVPTHPSYKGEPAKIAGMGTPGISRERGVTLSAIGYTPEGDAHIRGEHYKDLSPVVVLNAADEVIAITSVAACRTGATPGLGITLSTDLFFNSPTSHMDLKTLICSALGLTARPTKMQATRAVALSILGLPDTATDAEMEAAAKEQAPKPEVVGADSAKKIKDLSTSVDSLTKQMKEMLERDTKREREAILSTAVQEGKVIPPDLITGDKALDNTALRVLATSLAVTVPLDRRVHAGAAVPAGTVILSTEDEQVRKVLGLSVEDWKKHNVAA